MRGRSGNIAGSRSCFFQHAVVVPAALQVMVSVGVLEVGVLLEIESKPDYQNLDSRARFILPARPAQLLRPQAPTVVLFLQAADSYRKRVVSVGLPFDDFFRSDSFFSPQKTGDRQENPQPKTDRMGPIADSLLQGSGKKHD